jgi:hypothetical protein
MGKNIWINKDIIGVDFSGSIKAGKTIWIAFGIGDNDGLKILDCRRASDLHNSEPERSKALKALQHYVSRHNNGVIGFDFPFGLPEQLVEGKNWEDFIFTFAEKFSSPEQFRKCCFNSAGGRELKRQTDIECKAPFSPYNLRLFRQTYYGIRDLILPLVKNNQVSVLPMQERTEGKPWLIEICPASFLKREGYYISYKGRKVEQYQARLKIIGFLERDMGLSFDRAGLREKVLNDSGGDALDSIIASYCVMRAAGKIPPPEEAGVEGFTFY